MATPEFLLEFELVLLSELLKVKQACPLEFGWGYQYWMVLNLAMPLLKVSDLELAEIPLHIFQ
jgi:hypothetical protein